MINRVRELVRATIRAESGMRCSWLSARLSRDLVSHLEYNALLAISVARSVIAGNMGEGDCRHAPNSVSTFLTSPLMAQRPSRKEL
jgi:hypothetical protein